MEPSPFNFEGLSAPSLIPNGGTPLPTPGQSSSSHAAPIPLHTRIAQLARHTGGGIYCARETCKSKSGIRSKGHRECTFLYCKKCCQEAAVRSQISCHEPKHRLQPRTTVPPPFTPIPAPNTTPNYATPLYDAPQLPIGPHALRVPASDGDIVASTILPVGTANPMIQQPTRTPQSYAMPLAPMWQQTSSGWLENRQQAAREEDARQQIKKTTLESQQTRELQVTILSWLAVCHFFLALSIFFTYDCITGGSG